MTYDKPHLTYDKQLDLLASRGMSYTDRQSATRVLRAIGYYRLSAYTYVFRIPGDPRPDGRPGPRSDDFVPGTSMEAIVALHDFDRALRRSLLDGLQQAEIGLRCMVGYQLGMVDPFGHTNRLSLDPAACARINADGRDAFDKWMETYHRNIDDAKHEAYVQHFSAKYNRDMPVWVATELMTFGSLLWLHELLPGRAAKRISDNLGISDPKLLHRYLKALNVLRNHCAHNARVWNRSTIYPPAKPPRNHVPDTLHHLRACDSDRLYFLAALCAHFVTRLDAASNWPRQFATVV